MYKFVPNNHHMQELLIYFFNLKKSASEAHRSLVEAYGIAALSEESCREWFKKFENGDFSIDDKDRSERPKMFGDTKLEVLLEEDTSQTPEELALALGLSQQAVSRRSKSLGKIKKQGRKRMSSKMKKSLKIKGNPNEGFKGIKEEVKEEVKKEVKEEVKEEF